MTKEQEAFEEALRVDRYNTTSRLVYANYLEEHGLDDEALEQRRMASPAWITASRWMENFAADCGETCVEGYGSGRWDPEQKKVVGQKEEIWKQITYEDVIQAGHAALKDEWDYFTQVGSEKARDLMYGGKVEEFWSNWEIITGIKVNPEQRQHTVFSCSC